jgi:GNAT superfamily N-acetyltransferase
MIRGGRQGDLDAIVEFQILMARETEGLELDRETVVKGVQAVLDDLTKGKYWIAEVSGRSVGGLLTVPEWSDWRNGTVLWIHSLYVVPEMRGQGIFTQLYESLRARVERSPELKGLRLYVDKTNESASKVYERLGMDGEHYRLYEWMKE